MKKHALHTLSCPPLTVVGGATRAIPKYAPHALVLFSLCAGSDRGWCFDVKDVFAVSAGPVVLHPQFSASAGYNDNIYYLPSQLAQDDFVYVLSPGLNIRLGRPDGDNHADLTYRFDQMLYAQNDQADASDHSVTLTGGAKGARLSYDTRNSFQFMDSIMNGYTATIEGIPIPAGNVERNYFDLDHSLGYDLSAKGRLLLEGAFHWREYPAGKQLIYLPYYDSNEWRGTAGYSHALSDKTRLAGRFYYGQLAQNPNGQFGTTSVKPPHADYTGGTVDASGHFTSKLSGNVRVGYEYRWYAGDVESDGYPVAGIGLKQQFSEKTSASLNYNRGGSVSAYPGIGPGTSARVYPIVTDSVTFNVQQILGTRRPWFLNLGVTYAQNAYVTTSQSYDHLQVELGANYQLRSWAVAFVNYAHEWGNQYGYDYNVNRVSVGFSLGL